MNKLAIVFCVSALACASSDEQGQTFSDAGGVEIDSFDENLANDFVFTESEEAEDKQLGTVQQAISTPTGYGEDKSTGFRCTPGAGITCVYPKDKIARYRFRASTCNNWWQSRVVESFNSFVGHASAGGWSILDPTSSGRADVYLDCGDALSVNYGITVCNLGGTFSNPGGGSYRQYETCIIKIDNAEIEATPSWANKTDDQRKKMARDLILHEYMHSVGLGHVTDDFAGTALMMPSPGSPLSSSTWWNTLRFPTTAEINLIKNYVP